ncbi:MAG: T9SS type A sorting domain-containing protein [Bacteroidota bacterium]
MKKSLLFIFAFLAITHAGFSQLTGTKTIPGSYNSVAQAITALNTYGVGAGGVTFNVAAGYTETFAAPTDGLITATGTLANPIVFQKSGAGANPLITGASVAPGTMDFIIGLSGTDYTTFDAIDVQETTGSIEWGYAILKASAINGVRNTTIKNCTVTLNKTVTTTTGIYVNNHTISDVTQLVIADVNGINSNLKIFSNTISNCYRGIYLSGYNDPTAPYAYYDQNNEVGKDGANIINNVGGGSVIAYGIYAIYQNALKVANNIVTSTMGGTNTHYGIFLTTAKNASYDLYGNSVSMQFSGTGTNAFYPVYCEMGASGTTNTVNIYNNTVANCTYPTLTTGNVYLMQLLNLGVTTNIYGNTVSNNVIGATGVTATGRINYLYSTLSTTIMSTVSFHDNLVTGNSRIQSVNGGGATYFMANTGTGNLLNMYNNSVTNNIVASNGGTYCLQASLDIATRNIYSNTISNITKAEGTFYGLYLYNVTANSGLTSVYRNSIQNIEGLTAGSNMYGIYLTSSSGIPTNIYNNMIADLRTPAGLSGASAYNSINGIYLSAGSPVGIYHNTVFLNASSSAANFGTSALYFNTSSGMDLRNNILVNNSVPSGLGKTVAMRFSSITYTNYLGSSNYNNFYAGNPGVSNLIFFDGTNSDQTLAAFKTRVSQRELQSVTELPPFVNIASSACNVHLKNNVATQCESGGTVVSSPVAVTTDFDGDPRYPNTGYPINASYPPHAPDMGADEVGGMPNDLTAPSIVYTPLGNNFNNIILGNSRTLTATITDGTGVPVSGIGLPVLYWKINAGSYQAAQGTFVSGNTYSFTLGAGSTLGDIVSYYVAAQDIVATPNVGAYPWIGISGFTANPPAAVNAPSTPYTYTVLAGISGTYHVGVGKDYPTLTAAVNDINAKYINGPLTLILDDAAYPSETYPIILTTNPGSSAQNLLTIKPNTGASPALVTSIAGGNGLLHLSGFDYMVIDGSNNGTSTRNLTIQNTSTTTGAYGIQALCNFGTDPATNVTIKNCIIKGTPVNSSIITIVNIKFSTTGGGYDNFIIDNNNINGAFDAITISGSATAITHNCQITNNIIGSPLDAEAVSRMGVYITYADNTLVSGNDIMGPFSGSLNSGQTGVNIGTGSTYTKIRKNRIHDFYHNSDDGWGATGLWYASDASTVTEISDNSIYDIKAPGINPGAGQNITYGMFFRSGGNVKIIHNSINLTGPWLSTQYDASSACLGFYYQATGGNFEVRNNILRNATVPTTLPGSPYGMAFGIIISLNPSAMFSIIDNNDYFIDGYDGEIAQQYTNGTGAQVFFPTLASWQLYTGQEAASLTVNPLFTAQTNLLPTTTAMPHAGAYVPLVPTDINNVNRTNPPDIGAYEFTANPLISTLAASGIVYNAATINGSAIAAGTTFNLFFDWGLTTAYGNSVFATPNFASGTVPTSMSTGLTGLTGGTTYHYRARGVTSGGLIVYGNDLTFTTAPSPPDVITTAATAITASGATLNGTINANSLSTAASFEYGLTTSYGTTLSASPSTVTGSVVTPVSIAITGLLPNTLYHYRAKGVSSSGTTNGNDMTFTTSTILASVVTNLANPVGTTTATLNGTVTANNATTTISFQWGLTTAYGNTAVAIPASASGMTATPSSSALTGLAINTTYHFRCVGVNAAGTAYGLDQVFSTSCVAPVITITGPATACSGTAGYVYTTQSGNSSYFWNVSAGGTITSGAGTNSITVTWNTAGAQSVNVNYNNTFGCSASTPAVYNVTVNASPAPVITGSATACVSYTNNTYSTQAGMSNYIWTVSTGGTITAGAGTNAITVTWTTTGAKTVSVNYTNAALCAAPSPTVLNVTVNAITTPTISGQNSICANSGYIQYSTESSMTGYVWTVSAGGTISAGQGTNTIEVTWTATGAQTVSVNYSNANGCSAIAPTSYAVTVNGTPGAAGAITGTSTICVGAQGVAYSCAPITGAGYYVWTLPAGATVATGSGTTNITVNYAANAASGNINVMGNNLCGNGTASPNFPVTVTALPAASGAITGTASVCKGSNGVAYSVTAIANATSYTWTVPSGATLASGATTNAITVNFGTSAVSGNITVTGTNSCGNGIVSPSFAVAVNAVPTAPTVSVNGVVLSSSAASGNQWYYSVSQGGAGNMIPGAVSQTYTATQTGWYWCVVSQGACSSDPSVRMYVLMVGQQELQTGNFNIYPVPNDGRFTVSMVSPSEELFTITLYNNLGVRIHEVKSIRVNGKLDQVIDIRPAATGMYTVVIRNSSCQVVKKMIVNQ